MNKPINKHTVIHLILSSITLSLCIALTVMLSIFGVRVTRTEKFVKSHKCPTQTISQSPQTESTEVNATPQCMYVLGAKDGKLTVFAPDGQTVIDTLETYVYSLPLSDREAVAKGISVYSVNELISLIEDYTS